MWYWHVERSTGWIAEVRKLDVVAQKRPGMPKKTCDEVLVYDRENLGMDSDDPQEPGQISQTLGRGKQAFKIGCYNDSNMFIQRATMQIRQ